MKHKNCLNIAWQDIRGGMGMFLFYIIIITLLFSISVGVLDIAMYLPSRVSKGIEDFDGDWVSLSRLDIDDIEELLLLPIEFMGCWPTAHNFTEETLGLKMTDDEEVSSAYGGILIESSRNAVHIDSFKNKLIEGKYEKTCGEEGLSIWISDEMAKSFELEVGQELMLHGSDDEEISKIYISGIYPDSRYVTDYYISQQAYENYANTHKNISLEVVVRPIEFRNMQTIIAWAKKKECIIGYDEDMVNTIQMLYYTCYSLNIILLLALISIIYNLLGTYFEKKRKFYAINSAIGMKQRDIICIMLFICEIILILSITISGFVSTVITGDINSRVTGLFSFYQADTLVPIWPIITNFMILQGLIALILFRFWKKQSDFDIVNIIRQD